MKLKHIIPLAAMLGLSTCDKNEFEDKLEISSDNTLDAAVSGTGIEFSLTRDEKRPSCNFPVSAIELEYALGKLYTDAGRAKVVTTIIDYLGFLGWVEATGGPLTGCIGDRVPIGKERILAAINHHRKKNIKAAVQLAFDAMIATKDYTTFGNIRFLALEGARNPAVPSTERAQLYLEASKHGNQSYEENTHLAQEAVTYFVSTGQTKHAKALLDNLLPDTAITENQAGNVKELLIPPSIKVRKDKLLALLADANDSVNNGRFIPRPIYDPANPCKSLAVQIEQEKVDYHIDEIARKSQCKLSLILRAYETSGRFVSAMSLARNKGFMSQAKTYEIIVAAVQRCL